MKKSIAQIYSNINFRKILIFLIIFSPLLFSAKNIIPYYQYEVSGILDKQNLSKLVNTTLIMLGKKSDSQNWYPLQDFLINNVDKQDFPIVLTDSTGNFLFRVTTKFGKLDSLMIVKIDSNQNYKYSNPFYVGNSDSTEIKNRFEYSNQSGCSCENTTSSELVVSGYFIQIKNKLIKIN
jgi:hypothetical protein